MFSHRSVKALKKAIASVFQSLSALFRALFRGNRWVSFSALSLSVISLLVLNFSAQSAKTTGFGTNKTNIGEYGRTHKAVDWVVIDPVKEAKAIEKVDREKIGDIVRSRFSPSNARVAAPAPDVVGKWSQVFRWPVVAIHASLMPNGKVLAYDSVPGQVGATETFTGPHTSTRVTVWDPVTNTHDSANSNLKANLFCSGHTTLADGRVFTAGGNLDSTLAGISKTHIFNPGNNRWSLEGNMQVARWYPSVTTTAQGEVLITGGLEDLPNGGGPAIDKPELRATNGNLRALTGAASTTASNRFYGWLRQAPNGKVTYLGPENNLRALDVTGQGSWRDLGGRDGIGRNYGSFATYAPGKVLIAGGGGSNNSAVTVDLNTGATAFTSSMAFQRRQHNLTILADGTVLATGGYENSTEFLVDINKGVYAAEQWNPATGQWTTLASMQRTRQYHSTALLLPDGRVLSAGGGICGDCTTQNYLQKNAEIFSPPYLFKKAGNGVLATRPTVTTAPSRMNYNTTYGITTPNASKITKVSLVRFGGVTHSVNMDQQYQALNFTVQNTGRINVVSPANGNIAPPGQYMLFLVDDQGVPSVAKILKIV
jgi:hypothetical protein